MSNFNFNRTKARLRQLLGDDRGQTTAEYILILAVVVMIAMKFKRSFDTQITGLTDKVGGKISGALDDTN